MKENSCSDLFSFNDIRFCGDTDQQYPCWSFDVSKADKKEDYKYSVSCFHNGKKNEFVFFAKDFSLHNEDKWEFVCGDKFAKNVLCSYKKSGDDGVKEYLSKIGAASLE